MVIKSLKDRIRNKFNVSIAEVDANDLWQRSVIGVACVANETQMVNTILNSVRNIVLDIPSIQLIDSTLEML